MDTYHNIDEKVINEVVIVSPEQLEIVLADLYKAEMTPPEGFNGA